MRKLSQATSVAFLAVLLTTVSASAIDLNLGGNGSLLNLGNGGDGGSTVNVTVGNESGGGLLDLGGNGSSVVDVDTRDGVVGTVNLGNGKDSDVVIDLFGTGKSGSGQIVDVRTAKGKGVKGDVDLGISDGDADVVARLFGSGSKGDVEVDLLGGGSKDGATAVIDLFGPNDGSGSTGNTGRPGGNGGNKVAGGNGGDGDGDITGSVPGRTGNGVRLADRTEARGKCFAPDAQQVENLKARVDFSPADAAQWRHASSVQLTGLTLCPEAKAQLRAALAGDSDFVRLHAAVAADTRISGALSPGHRPEDVLAVSQSGGQLTVYVY